jgi:hypothetical protein
MRAAGGERLADALAREGGVRSLKRSAPRLPFVVCFEAAVCCVAVVAIRTRRALRLALRLKLMHPQIYTHAIQLYSSIVCGMTMYTAVYTAVCYV